MNALKMLITHVRSQYLFALAVNNYPCAALRLFLYL